MECRYLLDNYRCSTSIDSLFDKTEFSCSHLVDARLSNKVVLWEEPRTVDEAGKANASALCDRDVATEKAQLLFHTPKRHAIKVSYEL